MRYHRKAAESVVAHPPSDPSSDDLQRWMSRTMEGDTEALEALFRATYAPLCAVARRYVRSDADAEDVVEDTFLKLWTRRDRLHVHGSVKSYLSTAVRNTALNQVYRRRVEAKYAATQPGDAAWEGSVATNDAERGLEEQERAARVERAIDALPARAKETYCLYYHHRLTYAEIAKAMGVSVRTVEAQLVRSVRKLTKQLGETLD